MNVFLSCIQRAAVWDAEGREGLGGSAEEFQLGGFVPGQDAGWLRRLPQQQWLQGDLQLPLGAHRRWGAQDKPGHSAKK